MAKKKFLVDIDLNLNQLIQGRAENGTSFTTQGVNAKGRLMYDTSTSRVLYDTGFAVETIANLNDVAGLLDFHGGYDALTNTPNLLNPPSGTILKGDFYIVTVGGDFYGISLEIGDSLFSSIDNPTTINDWVIVQANVVYATETIAGIILLATQNEVNIGTDNSKAVTPLTLATYVANNKQNIYNTNGTLTANRTITLDGKALIINGAGFSNFSCQIDNGTQRGNSYTDVFQVFNSIYNYALDLTSIVQIQNGNIYLKVYNQSLTVDRSLIVNQFGTRINSIYYLPNIDGTAGQVMTTDGNGNLSWGTSSGVNIYNSDGTFTSNRNVNLADKSLNIDGSAPYQQIQSRLDNGEFNSTVFQSAVNIQSYISDLVGNNSAIDINSDRIGLRYLKFTPSLPTIYRGIEVNLDGLQLNGAYFLPNTDGTAGQVMTTDGNGHLSWGTGGSGGANIYNTDGTLTANRFVGLGDYSLFFTGEVVGQRIQTQLINGSFGNIISTITQEATQISAVVQDPDTSFQGNLSISYTEIDLYLFQNLNLYGFRINNQGVRVNNKFYLPNADGTAGQVLTTNGAGVTSWATGSGVNIYNIDGTLTANRTVNINNKNLTFNGTGSIVSINMQDGFALGSLFQQSLTEIKANVGDGAEMNYATIQVGAGVVNLSAQNSGFISTQSQTATQHTVKISNLLGGTDLFKTQLTAGGFRINDQYTFPTSDGTAGQVLTTNGLGIVSWGAGGSGGTNIYNTDGTLTGNRTVSLGTNDLSFNGNNSIIRLFMSDAFGDTSSLFQQTAPSISSQVFDADLGTESKIQVTTITINLLVRGQSSSTLLIQTNSFFENRITEVSTGNILFKTSISQNGLKINDVYTFPKVDGTSGQVLTTNGAGVVTWGTSSGVNIYNSDGTITANRTVSLLNRNLTFNGIGGAVSFQQSDALGNSSEIQQTASLLTLLSQNATYKSVFSQTLNTIYNAIENVEFGTVLFKTEITSFGLRINGQYTFPTSDGTAGQVLTTNGAGGVTWGTGGSGTTDVWKLNPSETFRGFSFNNNSTTIVSDGGAVASATASTLAQTVSGTSFVNKQVRLRYYASVVSAGRYTGLRGSALLWFIGGGFRYVCDFNISDTAYASGCQQFYGVANQTSDLAYAGVSGVQISTLLNIIGVGNETADANLQIFHNDATGTATKIDLGSGFPANRTSGAVSTTVYEIQILNLPATTSIQYRVVNKETGAIATGTLTTNLPDATLGLNFFASRCMSTIGSVTNTGQFDLCKLGVYSQL